MEYILGIPDDPSDHLNPVVLEHTKHEAAHCTTDQGFDSEVGDLLNTTDGVSLGEGRFLELHVPLAILSCHHDRVGTIQPVRNTILHPYDADRFHGLLFPPSGNE
jgi:hypothetical protein